jgi:hypothetical protein
MTKDEIVRLWMKANRWDIDGYDNTINDLKRYSELVIAAEREANALLTETKGAEGYGTLAIAAMIRKGGE